ncbi:acyl-CoA synthetase/AMP-acid ligase-like protein II [Peziza echinospora]|nr:acyl-CoA synthetase/AMP-acid ligase-like protein II [Peziza echinospora]
MIRSVSALNTLCRSAAHASTRSRPSISRRTTISSIPYASTSLRRGILTLSYSEGPKEPPLLHQTIGSHFAEVVARYGDCNAVISTHQNTRLTYHQLDHHSTILARGLLNSGIAKGDRVAVSLGNNIEYAVLHYALFKIGAILVPLNPSFNPTQVISALNHLGAAHLVVSTEARLSRKKPRSNEELLRGVGVLRGDGGPVGGGGGGVQSEVIPTLRNVFLVDNSEGRSKIQTGGGVRMFSDVVADGEGDRARVRAGLEGIVLSPEEVVNIQFTSGTTSSPKAACLTHLSILNNGNSIGDRMRLTSKDVVCCPPPLFHCFGAVLGYMACITHGASIVFPSESFDPYLTLTSIQSEKCTALHGVPTMFAAELELLQNGTVKYEGFEHLRTGIAAGSSVPAELMKKLHKVLNLTELTICYGMTETSPVSAQTTTDDPLPKRLDSVGRLLPHVAAKIVDPEDPNKILPVNSKGELAVSGYLLQKEYWNDPVRTREVMIPDAEGRVWMHTGDEAQMDSKGYIKITGRLKDLIIRGGENIQPLEIENILFAHPSIREVSIVGIPDARYGEVQEREIIVQEATDALTHPTHPPPPVTETQVREYVRERLSGHLVPKYVFFVDSYPKTASGKIMKYVLREIGVGLVREGKGTDGNGGSGEKTA